MNGQSEFSNKLSRKDACCANKEYVALGQNIRRMRRGLRISQEELAFRCGLHRTYLSDIERGARNPSLGSLLMVARGLNLTVSDLTRDIDVCRFVGKLHGGGFIPDPQI